MTTREQFDGSGKEPDRPEAVAHAAIRRAAETLAGGTRDLVQRAALYHHLFKASDGRHAFPLLAAHGALWASGYFAAGMRAGAILSWLTPLDGRTRRDAMTALRGFAEAFREINRRVAVETYATYHFTAQYGDTEFAAEVVPEALLRGLNRCHESIRSGCIPTSSERAQLFRDFFLWEQDAVVGPAVDAAFAAFDWPLIEWLARRPRIAFAYIPMPSQFRFRDFASKAERIERGLQAFALAERIGWAETERALGAYGLLPPAFFDPAGRFFADLRRRLVAEPAF